MLFEVLGPILVRNDEGEILQIARGLPRVLLALLLLKANLPIPADRLIDWLWHGKPPKSARSNLKTYVAMLRAVLTPGSLPVRTAGNGYLLVMEPDRLDATAFGRLAAGGRQAVRDHDLVGASRLFERALSMWRGEVLHGLDLRGELADWARRLEDERLTVSEDLIDVKLALGRHNDTIGDLLSHTARHPLRERGHAQLMLALYRSGRQSEALDAYHRLSHTLVDQTGVKPGLHLRELHAKILNGHPSLAHGPLETRCEAFRT
ncbi:AfsR/SARP family transcriptional regulator [Sphaerisporangium sp. NPDC051011]|uniref:AfsR/SARP family transcriptional regulator n=1 Tax=Sphaerisporangium sp. NPDC051011 TaxID=3155792 RepID=UPI0033C4B4DF